MKNAEVTQSQMSNYLDCPLLSTAVTFIQTSEAQFSLLQNQQMENLSSVLYISSDLINKFYLSFVVESIKTCLCNTLETS